MGTGGVDIQGLQIWLTVASLIVAGPFIVTALPFKMLEPLRKLILPVLRRGKLLIPGDSPGSGLLKVTVPQGFFTHFYVLGLAWNSVLLFTTLGFAATYSKPPSVERSLASVAALLTGGGGSELARAESFSDFQGYGKEAWNLAFLLLLLEAHLTLRLYECLFVSSFDVSARMSIFYYLGAMGKYTRIVGDDHVAWKNWMDVFLGSRRLLVWIYPPTYMS